VVDRDGTHIDELGQVVLVWDVVAVPRYHIKRRVLLRAAEKLAAEFIDNLPRFLLNLVLCDWV
jgi:hypothetical protein